MQSRLELSDDYTNKLEKENTYLKSSKELELSNMQSILEQMDTSNQLRQESMKNKLREIQKLEVDLKGKEQDNA